MFLTVPPDLRRCLLALDRAEPEKWLGASTGVGDPPGGVNGVPLVCLAIEDRDYVALALICAASGNIQKTDV